jgi:8-oxo-dGTP pyrophosphatase MutT (NUDIX family)
VLLRLAHELRTLAQRLSQRHTIGVKGAIFNSSGEVLLVRHRYGSQSWMFPGGGVRKGEAPAVALQREVFEELRLVLPEPILVGFYTTYQQKTSGTVYLFKCTMVDELIRTNYELKEAAYFAMTNLPENVSPATSRRLGELAGTPQSTTW